METLNVAIIVATAKNAPGRGTDASDFILGSTENDVFQAKGSYDWIITSYGRDEISIADGNHYIDGGPGIDTITAASGEWSFYFPTYYGYCNVINQRTGQTLTIYNIEKMTFGDKVIEFKYGTDNDNQIIGTRSSEYINGLDGNDTIKTGNDDDFIVSGSGADRVESGAGNDIIDDRYFMTNGNSFPLDPRLQHYTNFFNTGAGEDKIFADISSWHSYANSTEYWNAYDRFVIDGGAGQDVFYISDSANFLGDWRVVGKKAIVTVSDSNLVSEWANFKNLEQIVDLDRDIVWTLSLNGYARPVKAVSGTSLSEKIIGSSGNDTLNGKGGFDYFSGGAGVDTLVLSGESSLYSSLYEYGKILTINKDGFVGVRLDNRQEETSIGIGKDVEKIKFLAGDGAVDDIIFNLFIENTKQPLNKGTNFDDFYIITQGDFSDRPSLSVKAGKDHVLGEGNVKSVDGGLGDDIIEWNNITAPATFLGRDGNDKIVVRPGYIEGLPVPVIVASGGRGNDNITVQSIGKIDGGDGDDQIFFNARSNVKGGSGNDTLSTSNLISTSVIDGGIGDDVLEIGSSVTEFIVSINDNDVFVTSKYFGARTTITSVEMIKFDEIGCLTEGLTSLKFFNGDDGDDEFTGGSKREFVNGGAGDDKLLSMAGDDVVAGDDGDDIVSGGIGDDIISGGLGDDTLIGGAGKDIFVFSSDYDAFGKEIIADFSAGDGIADVITFDGEFSEFDSFEDVIKNATSSGDDTIINLRPNEDNVYLFTLRIEGVSIKELSSDDFLFTH